MAKYEVKAFPFYTEAHTWVKKAGGKFLIGITDYAQQQQGDVVYADIPSEGDSITQGESFGSIESAKATSELIAPVTGRIIAVNEAVMDTPDILNSSCYDSGWIIEVEPEDWERDKAKLMDSAAYKALMETLD